MKTDLQLQQDICGRLEVKSKLNPAEVAVSVQDGVVTLAGNVETEEDRMTTERAVRSIRGVKGVVDDELRVHAARCVRPLDAEMQAAAGQAIECLTTIPPETIKVTARDGWLTVEGQVQQQHQLQCVEEVLCAIPGLRGLKNGLTVVEQRQAA